MGPLFLRVYFLFLQSLGQSALSSEGATMLCRILLMCLLWVAVAVPLPSLSDDATMQGTIVVAKTEGDAVILWDITPSVRAFAAKPGSTNEKMRELEADAAKILLSRLGDVTSASTVSVRVLYQKIGAVNPVYNVNTFGGVEKVVVVSASRDS